MSKKKKRSSKWNMPKNAGEYFSPGYNAKFMKEHRFLTVLVVIVDFIVVLVPMYGYIFLVGKVIGFETRMNLLEALIFSIGLIGSAGIVIAVANVWMSVLDQYLGHKVTIYSLLFGIVVSGASLWLLALVH